MALISCPGCGNNVSDKAEACPKCGYRVSENLGALPLSQSEQQGADSGVPVNYGAATEPKPKRNVGKILKIAIPAAVAAAIVAAAAILIPTTVKVNSVNIDDWSFQDSSDGDDSSDGKYVATVSSSTKKPFIAIVTVKDGADPFAYMNSDTDEENSDSDSSDKKNSSKGSDTDTEKESEKKERPEYTEISYRTWDYVYMNEGKGEFELDGKYEPNDFEIKTYLSGDVLTSNDFESIKFDYVKYYDYDYVYKDKNDNEQTCKETRCNYVVNMKMKKPKTGVLFYTVHNTVTGKDSEVFQVAVNEGEICDKTYNGDRDRSMVGFNEEFGSLVESLGINQLKLFVPEFSVLPYKNRSNNAFEIKDMYFVQSNNIDSEAVSADKYYYDYVSNTYDCFTTWTAEVTMNEPVDGFLVYSGTLKQGGDKSQAGKTESHVAVMGSGISIIEAKDYYDKGFIDKDDFETPNYSFLYLGYVPVKTIDEK